jgi:hypothetical protein
MRFKIVTTAVFSCLLLTFACNTSHTEHAAALVNGNAPTKASSAPVVDGTNPPHAVDIDGKAIPNESTTEPTKPIILSKDSEDAKNGELKKEAAFDHVKHSTDANYSVDGKAAVVCADCHHTDQPKAPAGQEYLKMFKRTEMLTSEQLKKSNQPVQSCRACHFAASTEATEEYPPPSIEYPKESGKKATKDVINNEEAYHLNCNTCHDQALKNKARAKPAKAPQACADCHVQKKPT